MADVLAFRDIHFSRLRPSGEMQPILTGISWSVEAGQVAAILGANGSGKSTLLRLGVGYLWPQRGSVALLGETLGSVALAPLRGRVGILEPTTIYPFDEAMSALDVALSGYASALTIAYSEPMAEQTAHASQLLEQVGLANQMRQLYHTLSTGQRLRALLARALVRKPRLLILDEPTAGLDLPARESLLATLHRLHGQSGDPPAMVIVTHHLEELLPTTANVLLLSREGRAIAAGLPERVITGELLTQAYGVAVSVSRRHGRYAAHVEPEAWEQLTR